jgi:type IX secretion system PorP/SprF family membrane protein
LNYFSGITQDIPYANIQAHKYHLNPAAIGLSEDMVLSSSYMNKWAGMPSAFNTYLLSGIIPLPSYTSTFSLDLWRDEQGNRAITNTSALLKYAYNLTLYNNVSLLMGISSSYSLYKINPNRFVFESDILLMPASPNETIDNTSHTYFDFSIGSMLSYKDKYYSGISIYHITQPEISAGSRISPSFSVVAGATYHLGSIYHINTPVLEPILLYRFQKKNQNLFLGSSITFHSIYSALHFNFYKYKSYWGINSFSLSAGYTSSSYNIYYTYSVPISGYNNFIYKLGTHEVTFSYQLKYKRKKYTIK